MKKRRKKIKIKIHRAMLIVDTTWLIARCIFGAIANPDINGSDPVQVERLAFEKCKAILANATGAITRETFDTQVSVILALDKTVDGKYFRHHVYGQYVPFKELYTPATLEKVVRNIGLGYKGDRPPKDEMFSKVYPVVLKQLCRKYPSYGIPGAEADDIMFLAALAVHKHNTRQINRGGDDVVKSVILSLDRDLNPLSKYGVRFRTHDGWRDGTCNLNTQLLFGGPLEYKKGRYTATRKDNILKSTYRGVTPEKLLNSTQVINGQKVGIPDYRELSAVDLSVIAGNVLGKKFDLKQFGINRELCEFSTVTLKTYLGKKTVKKIFKSICKKHKLDATIFVKVK